MKTPKYSSLYQVLIATFVILNVSFDTLYKMKSVQADPIEPPSGQPGAPKTTTSGGSRPINSTCAQSANQSTTLTAIASLHSVGLTSRDRPTVWIYLPPTSAKTLEFSLFDQNRNGLYQASIDIENQTGFIPIALPSSAPALTSNQPYQWTVALVCDAMERTNDWVTGGWIEQRSISPALQNQLSKATPIEQIRLSSKAGFWYEAVDTYLRSHRSDQSRSSSVWTELLSGGNLKSIPPKRN